MGVFQITYNISWQQGGKAHFNLDLDENSLVLLNKPAAELPDWTDLDYCRCMNCPLNSATTPRCPAATSFVPVVNQFSSVSPKLDTEVETIIADRRITQRAPAQRAISSVIGVLFASSGCPRTVYFRPMVRYHIPLSNENETMMRAASMYTLSQYFKFKEGEQPDLELRGLKNIYEELQIVNRTMAERLQAADGTDTSVNAMILLDMYAHTMPYQIEDSLKNLQYLFKSFPS
ncbi:MAG: hypothetical protein RQ753_04415 [Desulfurivibrionaceae bacterium]|nr:hypothetical protein [Desulfobulbales bacterium]MDT8334919.1 hypothetical protein [Desulfurivibrionaceae bacterium]